jgi:hypothetical protein
MAACQLQGGPQQQEVKPYSSRGIRGCDPSGESAKGKEWQGFSPETVVGCGGSAKNSGEQRTSAIDGG